MVYLIIGVALMLIIAPALVILPNRAQKARMLKRQVAMAAGIRVELTHIEDPDPKKYLATTGKPLSRALAVVSYQCLCQQSHGCQVAAHLNWAIQRYVTLGESPVTGWYWSVTANFSTKLQEFMRINLVKLSDDVVMIEANTNTIVLYWHEEGDVHAVIDFLHGCAKVSTTALADSS